MLNSIRNYEPLTCVCTRGISHGSTGRERCYAERADDMHMDPKQPLRMRLASQF
jgi:hypothetical protein